MHTRCTQFGSTTALVALAVVVSLGSVTDVQAGVALAQLRPEARAQVVNDRQVVAEFLSCLGEAVRLLQLDTAGPDSVAVAPHSATFDDLFPLTAAGHLNLQRQIPPLAPLASHLIDLPPPAAMH